MAAGGDFYVAVDTAIAVLVAPSLAAIVLAIWRRVVAGSGDGLLLASGSALALFAALYIACLLLNMGSITRTDNVHPVQSLAEVALLSLSVGGTVGPIGIELGGATRAVAFIQILFTLGAVAGAVAWAWGRIIDRPLDEGSTGDRRG